MFNGLPTDCRGDLTRTPCTRVAGDAPLVASRVGVAERGEALTLTFGTARLFGELWALLVDEVDTALLATTRLGLPGEAGGVPAADATGDP